MIQSIKQGKECKNRANDYFKYYKLKMSNNNKNSEIPNDFRYFSIKRLLEIAYSGYHRSLQLNYNDHTCKCITIID